MKTNRKNLIYIKEYNKYVYNFQQITTIRFFAKNIYWRKISLDDANKNQSVLLLEIGSFNKSRKFSKNKKRMRYPR